MTLLIKDRVREITTSEGTGPILLNVGATTGCQTISSQIGDGNTTPYVIEEQGGSNWEIGVGQYIASNTSLLRLQVLASSNNNSLVNFPAGQKFVFVTIPAAYSALVSRDLSQFANTTSAQLSSIITDKTGTGSLVFANNAILVTPTIGVANGTSLALSGNLSGSSLISTVGTGTAPLKVSSNTLVANLNSDLLDNQHGSYYLDYTNLNNTPTVNNVTVVANTGLFAEANNQITTTYNTTISDAVSSVAVGGAAIAAASVWKTKTIVQVLDSILFPDQLPTYTIPTVTLSATVSGNQEVGSSISQVLTITATENDAGIFTSIQAKRGVTVLALTFYPVGTTTTAIAAQFGYADPNNPNFVYTFANTNVFVVTEAVTSWTGEGTYNAGLAKNNNKGVVDVRAAAVRSTAAPQATSTLASSAASITGLYPYFWGKSSTQPTAASIATAIAAGTTNKVLTTAAGTVIVTYAAVSEYVWMAHIATATSKTVWYNTALNNGSIGAGNFILAPVTQSVTSPNGYYSGVSFKIYISSGATDTSGTLEFRNV